MTLSPAQEKALAILLDQYQYYHLLQNASTDQSKSRQIDLYCLNQIMLFPDPVIWILYKQKVYQGTETKIDTLGDLKEHCDHGICQQRWLFLHEQFPEVNMLNPDTTLDVLANYLMQLPLTEQSLIKWKSYEYNGVNRIKKWNTYLAKIN